MSHPPLPELSKAEKAALALLGFSLKRLGSDSRSISPTIDTKLLEMLLARGLLEQIDQASGQVTLSTNGHKTAQDLCARYFTESPAPVAACPSNPPQKSDLPASLQEVLDTYRAGPTNGVFTDGGARPNPGPGGWGVVYVRDNEIIAQRSGFDPATTNNRMELTALIEAYRLLPAEAAVTIHSDSNLCVQTVNEWAATWKRRGWKKKSGAIMNLDLVKTLYELAEAHPKVKLIWVKAHNGWRWNEYCDVLASAWERKEKIPQFGP